MVEGIIRRGRRARARRRLSVAASALAAFALIGGLTTVITHGLRPYRVPASASGHLAAVPGKGPFLGWTVAGNAVRDKVLLSKALSTWDTQARTRHHNVHPLAMEATAELGPVVIVEASDATGHTRLGILSGQPNDTARNARLVLRVDTTAPPTTSPAIGTVSSRWGAVPSQLTPTHTFAIVLAQPGVTATDVDSTSVDAVWGDSRAAGRFGIQSLPPQATTVTTRAKLYQGQHVAVSDAPLDAVAFGDPRPVPVTIVKRAESTIDISATSPAVHVGDLAVTEYGLIGRVTQRTGRTTTVELATASGFSIPAHTSISNIAGEVKGTGHSTVFTQQQSGHVAKGNRVEVASPSTGSPTSGAPTVGFAATQIHYRPGNEFAATDAATLRPANVADQLNVLYVLTSP